MQDDPLSEDSGLVRGPRWRATVPRGARRSAAATSFLAIVAVGVTLLVGLWWIGAWLSAPSWVMVSVWSVPTVIVAMWTTVRAGAARVDGDDDDSWLGFTVRWALIGETNPRPLAARLALAIAFGAPVAWSVVLAVILTAAGVV